MKRRNILEADLEISPYEIDYFQVVSAFRLLNSAMSYLDFGSSRMENALDKLMQSSMIASSFLPDPDVCTEACICLERMLKITYKKDLHKVISANKVQTAIPVVPQSDSRASGGLPAEERQPKETAHVQRSQASEFFL